MMQRFYPGDEDQVAWTAPLYYGHVLVIRVNINILVNQQITSVLYTDTEETLRFLMQHTLQ